MSPIPPYTPGAGGGVSQEQVDASVAAAIAALVDSAPGTLDTLNELAAAMGDDPAFLASINSSLAAVAATANATALSVDDLVVVSGMYDSAVHGAGLGGHGVRPIGNPGGPVVQAPVGFFPIATVVKVTTPFASSGGTAVIALGHFEASDSFANPLFTMNDLDGTPPVVRKLGATSGDPAGAGSDVRAFVQVQALTAGAFQFHTVGFTV